MAYARRKQVYYHNEIVDLVNEFNYLLLDNHNIRVSKKKSKSKETAPQGQKKFLTPRPIIPNPFILDIKPYTFSPDTNFQKINNVLTYTRLNKNSNEYKQIHEIFVKNGLIVKAIKKVHNPYLKKAFEMKRQFHYGNIHPQKLFHGTKQDYVDDICTYNFNWRLSGQETGHKYGKGVNFAKNPFFAAFFGDRGVRKVVIMVDVLIKDTAKGSENLLVPPRGYDTTQGKNSNVFVKFYDDEFYPSYVINFLKKKLNK